jgi:hypothetical protein
MRYRAVFCVLFALVPVRAAWAAPLRVGASFEWTKTDLGSGVGFWLSLELPLERAVRPTGSREPALAALAEDASRAPPNAPQAKPLARRAAADSGLARAAVREARREHARDAARARLEGLATRARVSATLPELTLRAARSTDQSLRLSPAASEVTVYDYTQTGGADLLLEARATWTLDRLVFADEELGIERLRIERERADERLVERVLALVFAWERAGRRLLAPDTEAEARDRAELERFEAEAALDVLTGGWFAAEIARRRRVP